MGCCQQIPMLVKNTVVDMQVLFFLVHCSQRLFFVKVSAILCYRDQTLVAYSISLPSVNVKLPQQLAAFGDGNQSYIGALRGFDQVQNLQIQAIGDGGEAYVANLKLFEMGLNHGGHSLRYHLEELVPIAGAPEELQSPQFLRADYQRTKALSIVELFEANRFERRGSHTGPDRRKTERRQDLQSHGEGRRKLKRSPILGGLLRFSQSTSANPP
ncbi:hypothetical protein ACFX2B_029066 [Malus domestica]